MYCHILTLSLSYLVDGLKAKTCVFLCVKYAITAELQCSQFTVAISVLKTEYTSNMAEQLR